MRVLTIEARWAILIADDLRRARHPVDGVLKEVGLSRADVSTPEDRIPYAAFVRLIERAALLLADPAYGLKLGCSHDVRDHGLIGWLFMGLIFFPVIGLGPFAIGADLGIAPAMLSLGMVLTYSVVLGVVYAAVE